MGLFILPWILSLEIDICNGVKTKNDLENLDKFENQQSKCRCVGFVELNWKKNQKFLISNHSRAGPSVVDQSSCLRLSKVVFKIKKQKRCRCQTIQLDLFTKQTRAHASRPNFARVQIESPTLPAVCRKARFSAGAVSGNESPATWTVTAVTSRPYDETGWCVTIERSISLACADRAEYGDRVGFSLGKRPLTVKYTCPEQ